MKCALQVCERLDYGMVGLNRGLVSDSAAPVGGFKQSGLGREGGHEGMLEIMETQYISASWGGAVCQKILLKNSAKAGFVGTKPFGDEGQNWY